MVGYPLMPDPIPRIPDPLKRLGILYFGTVFRPEGLRYDYSGFGTKSVPKHIELQQR